MMYGRNDNKNMLAEYAKYRTKQKVKKAVFAFIKPYIFPAIALALVLLLIGSLVSTVYTQLTGGQTLVSMGIEPTGMDKEIRDHTIEVTERYNVEDTWVDGKNIHELVDAYSRDKKLALTWGQVFSVVSYDEISNREKITKDKISKVAKDLHPKFKYMASTKITESYSKEKGWYVTSKVTEYLLTSADTILGNYKFTYDRVTEKNGDIKITYHRPKETKLVGEQYERLQKYLIDNLKVENRDMDFQTQVVLEAGMGYDMKREQMEWLLETGNSMQKYISGASIPPDLFPAIKEMSEKYNIPIWFLASIILTESTFDPLAVNSSSGAIGLMQVMPDNWVRLAKKLGYDPEADKVNPRAQIEVGIHVLLEFMKRNDVKKVDWDSEKWKEQIALPLALYGGFGKSDDPVSAAVSRGYLPKIFRRADRFKEGLGQKIWPVPGCYTITSDFGYRRNPFNKTEEKHHDGIDIGAATGTPVVSVANAKVVVAGYRNGYGYTVVLRDMMHDYLYGHLSRINVSVGDDVQVGEVIGFVGSTGRSTGPHLHFGVSIGNWGNGNWINPLLVVSQS